MSGDRHEIVRRLLVEGPLSAPDLAEDFEVDGSPGFTGLLRIALLPDLVVEVDELFDAPGDRVVARFTVRASGAADAASWPAISIVTFRGDEVTRLWSLHDPLPWLHLVGAIDETAMEERLDTIFDGHQDATLRRLGEARKPPKIG